MNPQVNWNSILKKAKNRMKDSDMQKRVEKVVDDVVFSSVSISGDSNLNPSDAAKKFIEVLQNEIQNHADMSASAGGLGATAVSSLMQLTHGSPVKFGRNNYQITVSFADNLRRDSLYQSGYPNGVENIAALLNTGYDAGKRVYGTWHGNKIASLQHRDGARFIENAIRTFMENYAYKYGVVNIEVDDAYK